MTNPFPLRAVALLLPLMAMPVSGHAENADLVKIFGRDPGQGAAHACFRRDYSSAHLTAHPQQNVTAMRALVYKRAGEDFFISTLQVRFRDLKNPFEVSGGCKTGEEGKSGLSCWIDCDGGWIGVRARDGKTVLVDIPERARLYDPAKQPASDDEPENDAVPQKAHFGPDDKVFKLTRTDLKDCAGLMYDKDTKAAILKGKIKD